MVSRGNHQFEGYSLLVFIADGLTDLRGGGKWHLLELVE